MWLCIFLESRKVHVNQNERNSDALLKKERGIKFTFTLNKRLQEQ